VLEEKGPDIILVPLSWHCSSQHFALTHRKAGIRIFSHAPPKKKKKKKKKLFFFAATLIPGLPQLMVPKGTIELSLNAYC